LSLASACVLGLRNAQSEKEHYHDPQCPLYARKESKESATIFSKSEPRMKKASLTPFIFDALTGKMVPN